MSFFLFVLGRPLSNGPRRSRLKVIPRNSALEPGSAGALFLTEAQWEGAEGVESLRFCALASVTQRSGLHCAITRASNDVRIVNLACEKPGIKISSTTRLFPYGSKEMPLSSNIMLLKDCSSQGPVQVASARPTGVPFILAQTSSKKYHGSSADRSNRPPLKMPELPNFH